MNTNAVAGGVTQQGAGCRVPAPASWYLFSKCQYCVFVQMPHLLLSVGAAETAPSMHTTCHLPQCVHVIWCKEVVGGWQ